MEACENYQKQSYRNRCRIYAAEGVQNLNFPIVHSGGSISIPIREVLVDWSTPWLAKTKRCIDTAYRSSPFFDYYRDSLYALLDTRPETLWDLDMGIIRYFMQKIGLNTKIVCTAELERPYWQVFSGKCGFIPNLSVMDLLFNEGPGAIGWLL